MTALNKQALREAAQEEIMLRSVSYTSDAWQDEASPEVVLSLLDENLQLQRDKDSLEAVAIAMRDDMRDAREKLGAAEKRIAELVARIYIPQPLNIEDEYQNYEYVAGWNDCRNATACRSEHIDRAAGIGVKGE